MSWRRVVGVLLSVAVPVLGAGCTPRLSGEAELSVGLGAATGPPATRTVDRTRLAPALAAAGVPLPLGTNVYAVVLDPQSPAGRFDVFEAGGGSRSVDFWPASSVKLLAAVGALAFLKTLGFTGGATVTYADGGTVAVRTLYRSAIVDSSNEAYDSLLEIAGVDWLNTVFLTPENGFPESVIQRSYTFPGVVSSPEMTIGENGREVALPARDTEGGFGVPERGNRSNLLELTESVRRIVLHGSLPVRERFAIDAVDALDLEQALLAAEGFIEPVSTGLLVYEKPGYVPGDDCVDVAYIDDLDRREAYLLGVSMPDDGLSCQTLTDVARATLTFLEKM